MVFLFVTGQLKMAISIVPFEVVTKGGPLLFSWACLGTRLQILIREREFGTNRNQWNYCPPALVLKSLFLKYSKESNLSSLFRSKRNQVITLWLLSQNLPIPEFLLGYCKAFSEHWSCFQDRSNQTRIRFTIPETDSVRNRFSWKRNHGF